MHRALSLASGTALILLAACQPSKPVPLSAADSTAINKIRTDYIAAWNAGKVDAVVALYTSDAELQGPNRPAVKGSDALRTYFNRTLGTPTRPTIDIKVGTLVGRQDLAVMAGTYTLTPPAPPAPAKGAAPAPPAPIAAKYLVRGDEAGGRDLEDLLPRVLARCAAGAAGAGEARRAAAQVAARGDRAQGSCRTARTEGVAS